MKGVIMAEPEIVIVIEGGGVTAAATKGSGITYRVIDIDAIKVDDNEPLYTDYAFDAQNVNVEEYTKDILKDVLPNDKMRRI
ncbi:hypothetical protein METP3_01283 [Methanosarcinales archaeon]|nr:hypothetical protein METP3_01283 [Methanosarcinales archaeon]